MVIQVCVFMKISLNKELVSFFVVLPLFLLIYLDYWEDRYVKSTAPFDWYFDNHDTITKLLESLGNRSIRILNIGCGNSSLFLERNSFYGAFSLAFVLFFL